MTLTQLMIGFVVLMLVILVCILTYYIIKQQQQIDNMLQHHTRVDQPDLSTINGRSIQPEDNLVVLVHERLEPMVYIDPMTEPVEPIAPQVHVEGHGEEYFEELQHNNHNNDSQNVHNHQIVIELKRKYNRLIELNNFTTLQVPPELQGVTTEDEYIVSFIDNMFQELGNYMQEHLQMEAHDNKSFEKIQLVIETARKASEFTGFSDTDTSIREDWILAQVWYRIQSSDNKAVRDVLLTSLTDQLQDAAKLIKNPLPQIINAINQMIGVQVIHHTPTQPEIGTECIQGRIARYLQTFVHFDSDAILAQPVLDEKEYENEVYEKSAHLLSRALQNDPNMKILYDMQEDALEYDDLIILNQFKATIRNTISDFITNDYSNILPSRDRERLIEKCHAGI